MVHLWNVWEAGALALLGATAVFSALGIWLRGTRQVSAANCDTVFVFDRDHLVDATPPGRRLLRMMGVRGDFDGLTSLLSVGFGSDLADRLARLPIGSRLSLASPNGHGRLDVSEEGGSIRLVLRPGEPGGSSLDLLALETMHEELDRLRGLADGAPGPVWVRSETGALVWANRAYIRLAEQLGVCRPVYGWPSSPIFHDVPDSRSSHPVRQPVAATEADECLWFDVTGVRTVTGSIHFATDVTALVRAEMARLQFVQMLSRTFEDLDVGFAMFDRGRRLFLFNPAFVDLARLPVGFLTERPILQGVLDRMREVGTLPESNDRASWQDGAARLTDAAFRRGYKGTWDLPNGRVYQVTGQPHFDGALAILIEDVSAKTDDAR